ncbi:hypothetical protein MMC11_002326 [Xylographa trunciseda]|nr:hypothetical protein [Xylographa trunciseda]
MSAGNGSSGAAVSNLSIRGEANVAAGKKWEKFVKVLGNVYTESNPTGIISLGVAENSLMHRELSEYFSRIPVQPAHFTYGSGPWGSPALRAALSDLFNDHFKPFRTVEPNQIVVASGVSAVIDLVAFATADSNDGFLIGRPLYTGFYSDLDARSKVRLLPVSSGREGGVDPMGEGMVEYFEKEFMRQKEEGVRVRGVIFCNPHNPLGKCYSEATIKAYLRFCQRHHIHFISDEVYALSIFSTPTNSTSQSFVSVLSLDLQGLINPELVHVVYGMSKDFSSNGFRAGLLLSQSNAAMMWSIRSVAVFNWSSSIVDNLWTTLLEDKPFLKYYISENQKRLGEAYAQVTSWLDQRGIEYARGGNSGFFVWVDFSNVLGIDTQAGTEEMMGKLNLETGEVSRIASSTNTGNKLEARFQEKLVHEGVYFASGESFFAERNGWYRITFSMPSDLLEAGLQRVDRVLKAWKGGSMA